MPPWLQAQGTAETCRKDVTTHLVVSDDAGAAASAKLQRAAEWGIPVLQWAWLQQSAVRGRLLPAGLYIYSGTEASSLHDAKRPRTPLQAAAGAAARSTARPLVPSQHSNLRPAQARNRTDAGATDASSSGAAGVVEPASERQPDTEQENSIPQGLSAAAVPLCGRGHAADCTQALVTELRGMQVQSSPISRSVLASVEHASSTTLRDDPAVAAAASQSGSCTCSVASDDDGIECSQRPPGRSQFLHGTNSADTNAAVTQHIAARADHTEWVTCGCGIQRLARLAPH